jgi:hypothetical protein
LRNRITIVTGQHLIFNPRVWKEANALSAYGHQVTIFTTWHSSKYLQQDKSLLHSSITYIPSFSLIPKAGNDFLIFCAKALKKIANFLFVVFRISSTYQLMYMPKAQLKNIVKKPSDLFICHQEAGLIIGTELMKQGHKVAFDFEDWYSEDYIRKDRPRHLLRKAESFALKSGCYVTCPSQSMVDILQKKYGDARIIASIYNSFPIGADFFNSTSKIPNSLVWFSQTIGPGRGIEEFIGAIKDFDIPLNLHFIGNCSSNYEAYLYGMLEGTLHKLHKYDLMPHNDLMKFIQAFEIGLALEYTYPLNKNFTISNKILTYLQLGLKVLASSTDGQLELKEEFNEQLTYIDLQNANDVRERLIEFLNSSLSARSVSTPNKYNWEIQQEKILSLVNQVIKN